MRYEYEKEPLTDVKDVIRFLKQNPQNPYYDFDTDYTTNSPSYYDYLAKLKPLIQILAERIYDYDKELAKRFEEWDKNLEELPDELKRMFLEWVDDGTLARILAQLLLDDYATKEEVNELLNALENELNLSMVNLKNDLEKSMSDLENDLEKSMSKKESKNAIYKLKPLVEIPVRFPDYNKIVGKHDLKNIYPSAFDIDWDNNLLFLVSLGALLPSGAMQDRIITMYDITTGEYKGYFYAGIYGGEGIVVKWENNKRYLYCQNGLGYLGKYDITLLPKNASKLESIENIHCNVHWTFGYDGTNWLITQGGSEKGYKDQRRAHAYYSDNFRRLGYILTDTKDTGYFNSDYYSDNTKVQSMTIGNGKIYMGIGAYHADGRQGEQGKIGIKVLDSSGNLIETGLMNSQKVINKLNDMGKNADIIENEGVHVKRDDGRVFSLMIFRNPERNPDSINGGIYIMEHYSSDLNAIDFSECSSTLIGTSIEGYQPMTYQDPNGKMFLENHLTGKKLNSMSDILTYMVNDYRDEFSFYSSSVEIKWFDNVIIPASRYIKIENINNRYFHVTIRGYKDRPQEKYFVDFDIKNNNVSSLYEIPESSVISTYVKGTDLYKLPIGFYEMTLNKTVTELPETFPNSDALCFISIKGSTTRKSIEIHVVKTNQVFIGGTVDNEKIKFKEL